MTGSAKQSILSSCGAMDCFASLANDEDGASPDAPKRKTRGAPRVFVSPEKNNPEKKAALLRRLLVHGA
jgi:hypothetical protein